MRVRPGRSDSAHSAFYSLFRRFSAAYRRRSVVLRARKSPRVCGGFVHRSGCAFNRHAAQGVGVVSGCVTGVTVTSGERCSLPRGISICTFTAGWPNMKTGMPPTAPGEL